MNLPQTLKGFRDILPNDARIRQHIIQSMKTIFERFGFDPLETPALEYASVLLGKYGDEADKLIYLFKDHGGRDVGMRYDQTIPLARVIAQHCHELPMPFKRYQIQPVWRAENTQKGRFREFLQCDIDTVGTDSPIADAEVVACALEIAKTLGFPSPNMHINDRALFDTLRLSKQEIIILDKLDKIGKDAVIDQLNGIGVNGQERFEALERSTKTKRLKDVCSLLELMGYAEGKDFTVDPFLARGLDYYTSAIFELKDPSYPQGSLAGGGRYDNLIGIFLGRSIPAVGIAFGFDRIIDALQTLEKIPKTSSTTRALVCIFSQDMFAENVAIATTLRNHSIPTELYLDENAKLEKQLKYADKKGIPFALIQGPEEKRDGTVIIKRMTTKEQLRGTVDDAIRIISAHETT